MLVLDVAFRRSSGISLQNAGAVEVAINTADLQDIILSGRTLRPGITIRPVVPRPES